MKRRSVVLSGELLEEALRLSGERTYSRVVARARSNFVGRLKARRILDFAGSGLWDGDLARMRRDAASHSRRKKRGGAA